MFPIGALIMLSANGGTCAAGATVTGGSAIARRAAASAVTGCLTAPNQWHQPDRADT